MIVWNKQNFKCIRTDEPTKIGIVVPALQIIQPSFLVEYIPTIPERLDRTQRAGKRTSLTEHLAPSIVSIGYHFVANAVNQANDVTLQVIQVSIRSTVEQHHSWLVLCIVEEMQAVAALGHVDNVLAVQGVVGGAGRNGYLLHTQAVLVVHKPDNLANLADLLELTALFPDVAPGTIAGRIANRIVGDACAIEGSQLVLPVGIAIGVRVCLNRRTNRAGSEGIRSLALDVAAQVIGIFPGCTGGSGSGIIRIIGTDQLAQQIVLVGDGLAAIADTGDVARIVIRIG